MRSCTGAHSSLFLVTLGVVIIDDHPEVTTLEDPQSNTNDDGFTEVVSRKQQKRLQDEERRKKEEQTVQVCIAWTNIHTFIMEFVNPFYSLGNLGSNDTFASV